MFISIYHFALFQTPLCQNKDLQCVEEINTDTLNCLKPCSGLRFFDTPKIDRIIKDRAAKFVDMLSAIGGTMGLLTGFSIISGVEIIYFAAKILWSLVKKNDNKIKIKK